MRVKSKIKSGHKPYIQGVSAVFEWLPEV